MVIVPNRLKEWRQKRHMTQGDLAKAAGVSRATVIAIERGADKKYSVDTLLKLAEGVNKPLRSIFFTK